MGARWAIVAGAGLMLAGCDSAESEPAAAPPTVTATVTATEEVEVTRDVEVTETVTETVTVEAEAEAEDMGDALSGEMSDEMAALALEVAWSNMESDEQSSLCEFYVLAPELVADMFVEEAGESFDSRQIMEFFDGEC